jgi:hypothetical protein
MQTVTYSVAERVTDTPHERTLPTSKVTRLLCVMVVS